MADLFCLGGLAGHFQRKVSAGVVFSPTPPTVPAPVPHWRAIRAQAIRLSPLSPGGHAADCPVRPNKSEQAITTATAVLAWVERLDQGEG